MLLRGVVMAAVASASTRGGGGGGLSIEISTEEFIAQTSDHFVCWNIDASRNRQFFDRDLDPKKPFGAQLARQAKALSQAQQGGHSLLRFGGGGNDHLTYAFGNTKCPKNPQLNCLNQTWWSNLLDFARAADARIIFGIAYNNYNISAPKGGKSAPGPAIWNSSNAHEILTWTIEQKQDDLLYGFELGNEQDGRYNGSQSARNLKLLYELSLELWPDETKRPILLGPDAAHQHREPNPNPTTRDLYVHDFMLEARRLRLPLRGATLHKYIEVSDKNILNGTKLDETYARFGQYKDTVLSAWGGSVSGAPPPPRLWGGEVGPHNGGSLSPCNHSGMRWANFADSLWYVDSLAIQSKLGYEAFCRQDYIGIDYGMVDCLTGSPLPDYWAALLWTNLVGARVLNATVVAGASDGNGDHSVRAYAHCAKDRPGKLAVVAINLRDATVRLEVSAAVQRRAASSAGASADARASARVTLGFGTEYQFSAFDGPGITNATGLFGTAATLNGKVMSVDKDGNVPELVGKTGANSSIVVPPQSIVFVVYANGTDAEACL